MHKIEEAGVPRDQYGSERFREASLDELGAYFKLPADEVHKRLEKLAEEGGISCLHLDEETGTVSFSDGSGVKKCSDYRSRLKEAGFVSVTCWLTPEQAELVKEWHRFNVQSREHGPEVVAWWRSFLKAFGAELASSRICAKFGNHNRSIH